MPDILCETLISQLESLRQRTLATVSEMTRAQLLWRPAGSDANPSGFLLWHLARREDLHVQERINGGAQVWVTEGWHAQFGIAPEATGFGFTAEQVRDFPMPALQDIIAYYNRVRDTTLAWLATQNDAALLQPMPGVPEMTVWTYMLARVGHEHEHWGQIDYLKGLAPQE